MKVSLPVSLALFISVMVIQGCSTTYTNKPASSLKQVEVEYDAYYGFPQRDSVKDTQYARKATVHKSFTGSPFRKNAPTRYVVKPGDTLWGISKMFLKDPYYWPEIWDKNKKVRNPHRIYPGDVLTIINGHNSVTGDQASNKLIPTIRITRLGTGMPISTLAPFLAWPRVVDKDDLTSAPYIIAARDAKLLLEEGKDIYVKGLSHAQRGDTYGIYHTGKELRDPETNELLGTEITYHGQASIVSADEITTARIEKTSREIRRGDRLIKVDPRPRALSLPIHIPRNKVRGTVMSLYDADLISGQRMIAVINRGARDGIRAGQILGVYSPPRFAKDPYEKRLDNFHSKQPIAVKLPPERVGSMIVYEVTDRLSYALISKSDHPIKKGYKVGNP